MPRTTLLLRTAVFLYNKTWLNSKVLGQTFHPDFAASLQRLLALNAFYGQTTREGVLEPSDPFPDHQFPKKL